MRGLAAVIYGVKGDGSRRGEKTGKSEREKAENVRKRMIFH